MIQLTPVPMDIPTGGRDVRRVVVNSDQLRAEKLAAGDLVRVEVAEGGRKVRISLFGYEWR
jgi:hypothetical protein